MAVVTVEEEALLVVLEATEEAAVVVAAARAALFSVPVNIFRYEADVTPILDRVVPNADDENANVELGERQEDTFVLLSVVLLPILACFA